MTTDLVNYTKEFGFKSKLLGVVSPGSWNAKEAAKYMYNTKEEYKKHRGKEALKGLFTPIASARRLERAKTLYEMGATPDQIKKSLDKRHLRTSGVIGSLIGIGGYAGNAINDALDKNRKKFD